MMLWQNMGVALVTTEYCLARSTKTRRATCSRTQVQPPTALSPLSRRTNACSHSSLRSQVMYQLTTNKSTGCKESHEKPYETQMKKHMAFETLYASVHVDCDCFVIAQRICRVLPYITCSTCCYLCTDIAGPDQPMASSVSTFRLCKQGLQHKFRAWACLDLAARPNLHIATSIRSTSKQYVLIGPPYLHVFPGRFEGHSLLYVLADVPPTYSTLHKSSHKHSS
jgi:hypothetical protein